ncbi:DUF6894 family protein [Sphingomonas sp. URHD0057]|uniref:DUF6894 family protein n=1 Tax=Sphingomonas sp. URHD0057 TaxID=1380389 RepID=UPI001E2BFF2E|nr:hypothetical protein [Sphingomonas sp. URHD0057]
MAKAGAPVYARAMPLYYFNLYNDAVTMDDEGVELADPEAARAHAIKEARHMAADSVLQGHFACSHRIEFVDGERAPVGAVRFDEAVEVRA